MCIVSIKKAESGKIILTHNRDEAIDRQFSKELVKRTLHGVDIEGTLDLISGGSWFFASERFVACVLNGEFKRHLRQPPYRLSRGQIVLELLKYESAREFMANINLYDIEPFTVIILNRSMSHHYILVWDGKVKHTALIEDLDEFTFVRSSSTLYGVDLKKYIAHEMQKAAAHPQAMLERHLSLRMVKNNTYPKIQTTSITQCVFDSNELNMKFCPEIHLNTDIQSEKLNYQFEY